jgi:hypothetical protein
VNADAHLTVIRKLTNFAETSPSALDGPTAVALATDLSRLVRELDTHLSAGGTPPEAWREGPDAPASTVSETDAMLSAARQCADEELKDHALRRYRKLDAMLSNGGTLPEAWVNR